MIKPTLLRVLGLVACFFLNAQLFSQTVDSITADEFVARRTKLLELMPDSSLAVFHSALEKNRSNDVEYEYRQDSNLLYLTGITDKNVILVLAKQAFELVGVGSSKAILFIPRGNPYTRKYLGETISADQARKEFGFKIVESYNEFPKIMESVLINKKKLLYSFPVEMFYEVLSNERYFVAQDAGRKLKGKFSDLEIQSPHKLVSQLRQIKSPTEIRLLQKAIDITTEAHLQAMRAAKPGLYEYQLEAVIEFIFKLQGAEYPAFPSIIGSGPNSTILHHWENRRKIEEGDLIVIDVGAEYHGYSADITRTIPANGRFSKEQREIYKIVLKAQRQAMSVIRPGVSFKHVHEIAEQVIGDAGYGKYFLHGTSHYLGLDTHDVGNREGALRPGMVLTVEPGIYIREGSDIDRKYWNIGIRIEDDVLVTEDGYKVLSDKAPKEIIDIEELMKQESGLISID